MPEEKSPKSSCFEKIKQHAIAVYNKVWSVDAGTQTKGFFGIFSWLWRVIELTIAGTLKNTIPLQAAALTYYALMALAPFAVLVLTIFAFVMNVKGEDAVEVVQERMTEMLQLVLPEAHKNEELGVEIVETRVPVADPENSEISDNFQKAVPADEALETLAPQLQEFSGMLLRNTLNNSGSSGTIGLVILLVLAVFTIARIEDAFNLIWNVKKARSWPRRFAIYFAVILLGGALFAFTMSMLSVSAVMKTLAENASNIASTTEGVPVVSAFAGFMTSAAPSVIAFVLMTLIFGCLNKYLPFVDVKWVPALVGGGFVSVMFIACGKMASLFVGKISEFNSVYGNLSVIFILMFGLYLGWMFLLIGGEVAYSIQNARYFKNINRDWKDLSPRSKQNAYFACLFMIYETEMKTKISPTEEEISLALSVPANLIRECLTVLKKKQWISEVSEQGVTRFQCRTFVNDLTVAQLRREFENLRNPLAIACSESQKNAREHFDASFESCKDNTTMKELIG